MKRRPRLIHLAAGLLGLALDVGGLLYSAALARCDGRRPCSACGKPTVPKMLLDGARCSGCILKAYRERPL